MDSTIPKKPDPNPPTNQPAGSPVRRCPAAHPDDRSPCDGPSHSVEVTDRFAHHVMGCLWHGAVLYASLSDGIMLPVLEDHATVQGARRIATRMRDLYSDYWDRLPEAKSPQ